MVKALPGPVGGAAFGPALLVGNFGQQATIVYFRVVGAGTIRLGTSKASLETSDIPGQDDGLPQVVGDGEVRRLWAGDLWASASAATFLITMAPEYAANPNRGTQQNAVY